MRNVVIALGCVCVLVACRAPPPDPETPTCDLSCGDGFGCRLNDASEPSCVLAEGQVVSVTVTSPSANELRRAGQVSLGCNVTAPQLAGVVFKVTPAGGTTQEIAGTRASSTEPYSGSYLVAGDANGAVEVVCEATFGPSGYERTQASTAVTFKADTTAPEVETQALNEWHRRSGTVEVRATLTDANGIASATLTICLEPVGTGVLHGGGVESAAWRTTCRRGSTSSARLSRRSRS